MVEHIIELLNYADTKGVTLNLILTILLLILFIGFVYNCYKKWVIPLNQSYIKKYEAEEEKKAVVEQHGQQIMQLRADFIEMQNKMNGTLEEIKEMNNQALAYNLAQTEVIKTQVRHSLVRAAQEAINKDCITASELKSLEELNEIYQGDLLKGNSYVHILMHKVEELEVVPDGTEEYIREHTKTA